MGAAKGEVGRMSIRLGEGRSREREKTNDTPHQTLKGRN
jgi:hypothetical protein